MGKNKGKKKGLKGVAFKHQKNNPPFMKDPWSDNGSMPPWVKEPFPDGICGPGEDMPPWMCGPCPDEVPPWMRGSFPDEMMGRPFPEEMCGPCENVGGPFLEETCGNMGDPFLKKTHGPRRNRGGLFPKKTHGPWGNMGGPFPEETRGPRGNMGGPFLEEMHGPQGNMGGPFLEEMHGPRGNMGGPFPKKIRGPQGNIGGPFPKKTRGPWGNMGGPFPEETRPRGNMGGPFPKETRGPQGNMGDPFLGEMRGPQGNMEYPFPEETCGPRGNLGGQLPEEMCGPQGNMGGPFPEAMRGPWRNMGSVFPEKMHGPRGNMGGPFPEQMRGPQENVTGSFPGQICGPQGNMGGSFLKEMCGHQENMPLRMGGSRGNMPPRMEGPYPPKMPKLGRGMPLQQMRGSCNDGMLGSQGNIPLKMKNPFLAQAQKLEEFLPPQKSGPNSFAPQPRPMAASGESVIQGPVSYPGIQQQMEKCSPSYSSGQPPPEGREGCSTVDHNLYRQQCAAKILETYGLSIEDVNELCCYPDDQLKPENVPAFLEDIRKRKVAEKMKHCPAPSMMNDYFSVTPRLFPHTCSLCKIECRHAEGWFLHLRAAAHSGSCDLLRQQYPHWNPEDYFWLERYKNERNTNHDPMRQSTSSSHSGSRSPRLDKSVDPRIQHARQQFNPSQAERSTTAAQLNKSEQQGKKSNLRGESKHQYLFSHQEQTKNGATSQERQHCHEMPKKDEPPSRAPPSLALSSFLEKSVIQAMPLFQSAGAVDTGFAPGTSGASLPSVQLDPSVVSQGFLSMVQLVATQVVQAVLESREVSAEQTSSDVGHVSHQPCDSASLKKEKKEEAKKQALAVQNPSPAPGLQFAARLMRVLLVGHNFLHYAKKHAARSPCGIQLGFGDRAFFEWMGQCGMRWVQLLPTLKNRTRLEPPDVLVIHLGGNDLGHCKGIQLSKAMQKDLLAVKKRWPDVRLVWSAIVPRMHWPVACDPRRIDEARRSVNKAVAKFLAEGHGTVIEHSMIRVERPYLYRSDGISLNVLGMEIFLMDLQQGLQSELGNLNRAEGN